MTEEEQKEPEIELKKEEPKEKLKEKTPEEILKDLKLEVKDSQDKFLRSAAELENYKRRSERDKLTAIKFANESILTDLLPVLDHLEQALLVAKPEIDDAMVTGVKMVLKQFEGILGGYGVQGFSALGEKFDHSKHEAVAEQEIKEDQEEEQKAKPGEIIQVYQKGYYLNNRLVRPARVIVAK